MKSQNAKLIKAIRFGIDLIEKERRKHGVEYHIYLAGAVPVEIDHDGISGIVNGAAETGYKKYMECNEMIDHMYDLIEMLQDDGIQETSTKKQLDLFENA